MASKRTILSRPRTRIYDVNYDMGENIYRPALDRLDRKYSGRPLSPPRQRSLPRDLVDRHDRAFADQDLFESRRRAEKHITGETLFDSRGARLPSRAEELLDNFNEETVSRIKNIRANKKVSLIDDVDLESTVTKVNSKRLLDRSEKILDSVGIDERSQRRPFDEESGINRRSLKVAQDLERYGTSDMVKWSAVGDSQGESAAAFRARQSKARLNDLEQEMEALSEKQAVRERRAARLRALAAEIGEESEMSTSAQASSHKSVRIRDREERIEY